jgi:Zn-dependent M28 family amino/carboxypeptidase
VSANLGRVSIKKSVVAAIASDIGIPSTAYDSEGIEKGTYEAVDGGGLRLVAAFDETDPLDVPNVVGYIPGSDNKLRQELVGIGAHLDHLGKNGETVYPGADDDGSGSTALLEVAKAYHLGGQKPKRSILFMAFCGEEMGLLGSGYYSDNPIFPHENMVAELQMDMVGRDSDGVQNGDRSRVDKREENIDTIRLVGSKRISTDLNNLIEQDNKYIGFKFKWDAEDVYTRSDHYNFAKVGIPIAFLFDGFHPDYHRPTDTVDKIDWVKLTNAAKLYYIVSLDLANNPQRPRHDVPQTGQ